MIETTLNIFDAIVFGVMAISCLHAFFRGFVREILSLGAWACAGIVTLYFFPTIAEHLKPKFKDAVVAAGFSTLGIYITALMGFSLLNSLILKFIKSGSDVGMLDNMLGLFFGAFRGAFLLALGFFLMTIAQPEDEYPEVIKTAVTMPYVERCAIWVAKVSPNYLTDISSLKEKIAAEEEQEESSEKSSVKTKKTDKKKSSGGGIGAIGNPFAEDAEEDKDRQ